MECTSVEIVGVSPGIQLQRLVVKANCFVQIPNMDIKPGDYTVSKSNHDHNNGNCPDCESEFPEVIGEANGKSGHPANDDPYHKLAISGRISGGVRTYFSQFSQERGRVSQTLRRF